MFDGNYYEPNCVQEIAYGRFSFIVFHCSEMNEIFHRSVERMR